MPYGVMSAGNGPTAPCSLWGWMALRRAAARLWGRPWLIHTASVRDTAELRQPLIMHVIMQLWVASDTLVGRAPMRGIVWSSWRVRALRCALCCDWASLVGVCTPACLGLMFGLSAV